MVDIEAIENVLCIHEWILRCSKYYFSQTCKKQQLFTRIYKTLHRYKRRLILYSEDILKYRYKFILKYKKIKDLLRLNIVTFYPK